MGELLSLQVHKEKKMDLGCWEFISPEILEKILLAVPTYQLPCNKAFVCKKWTRIILQPQFWVYKLKMHGINIDKVWPVLKEFENNEIVFCLYYASLFHEHLTQETPVPYFASKFASDLVLSSPTDENLELEVIEGNWYISDDFDEILMASGIFVCISHWSYVYVHILLEKKNIKALPLLLKLIEARKVPLSVKDNYAFWNFYPRINFLQILKGSSDEAKNLNEFRGCLPTLEGLPSSQYINLYLSIGVDDQNVAIDPGMSQINKNTNLLYLHLKSGSDISNFRKISSPGYYRVICVSDLEPLHLLWMTEVTRKFLSNECILVFFNYKLDLKSSEKLLNNMAQTGINIHNMILCSSSTLSFESKQILNDLATFLWPDCPGFELFASDGELLNFQACHAPIIPVKYCNSCEIM